MHEVNLKIVGVVHTNASDDDIRSRRKDITSTVEIFPEFAAALEGVEGFSHIFVIGYLNRLRPEQIGPLKVKPKGLLRQGLMLEELPLIGVFALDSPTRPNPIGLGLAHLIKRTDSNRIVSDLDFFDGTPVLDIKPYQGSYRVEQYSLPDWHRRLLEKAGHV